MSGLFPEFDWVQLTLPPRHFRWRLRGNSLSWAFKHRATLTDNYDFLLSTSMTDLSALRGFVPELARLPTVVYFHENQFVYPQTSKQIRNVEPLILNLYTALCADIPVFNSHYNRDSFFEGATAMLRKMPDELPAGLLEQLRQRCQVIPVPLPDAVYAAQAARSHGTRDCISMVWNHRWEYDKGPEQLLEIVRQLISNGVRFRLHLLGQQFRQIPEAFQQLQAMLADYYQQEQITPGHSGYIQDRQAYYDLLAETDIVLSTALHDFQGLALLEAIALGCTPLAPARMVYPEYLPSHPYLYDCHDDIQQEAQNAAKQIHDWAEQLADGDSLPRPDVEQFRSSRLQGDYANLFAALERNK